MQTGQETPKPQIGGDSNPLHHTRQVQQRLQEPADHLREDIEKFDEPRAKALFETSAEVLNGLIRAFKHYGNNSENAWRA